MPPVAPVTSAPFPVRSNIEASPCYQRPQAASAARCGFELVRRADAACLDAFEAPRDAGEHAPSANLIDRADAVRFQIQHRLPPPHHAGHLLHEPRPDGFRVRDRRCEHIGDQRNRGRIDRYLGKRLAHRVRRGLHQRAMEGGAHRQQHRAAGAEFRRQRHSPIDGRLGARDHHLAWRIIVGGLAHFAFGSGLGQLLRLRKIGAEQSRHRPLADGHRLLHGAASDLEQPRRIGEAERAGRGKRRIFSERMARDISDFGRKLEPLVAKHTHRGERHGHQRRLRILGERQFRLGPVPHQPRKVLRQCRIDLIKHGAR